MTFEEWLESEGLARTSIRKVTTDIEALRTRGPAPEAVLVRRRMVDYRWAWAWWADYCDATGRDNDIDEPAVPEEPSSRIRRRKNEPVRLQDATSIPLEQWRVFLAVVGEAATHSTPASVIDVLCMSALRIGDVLRTSRTALDAGFAREDGITTIGVKGARGQRRVIYSVLGARDEWERLRVKIPRGKLVCDVVAPRGKPGDWTASGAAYQACRRKLAELGAKAGIEDRLHLHRLRRTVAVQAALATGNKLLVQKLLRQHSAASAERYTDEAMEAEIVAALAQIRRKVRG